MSIGPPPTIHQRAGGGTKPPSQGELGLILTGATFGNPAKKSGVVVPTAELSSASSSLSAPSPPPSMPDANLCAKGSPQGRLRYKGANVGGTTKNFEILDQQDEALGNDEASSLLPTTASSRFRESLKDVVSTNRRINTPPPFVVSHHQTSHNRNTTSAPSTSLHPLTSGENDKVGNITTPSSSIASARFRAAGRIGAEGTNLNMSAKGDDEGLEQLLDAVSATNDELLNVLELPTVSQSHQHQSRYEESDFGEGTDSHLDTLEADEDEGDDVRVSTASSLWSTASSSASAFSRRSSAAMWWRSRGRKRRRDQSSAAVNDVTDSFSDASVISRSLSVAALSRIETSFSHGNKADSKREGASDGAAPPFPVLSNTATGTSSVPLTADGTAIALTKADIANIKDEETLKFLADNSRWLTKYIVERERLAAEEVAKPTTSSAAADQQEPPSSTTPQDNVTALLDSTFITAVDAAGKTYTIAVVEPHLPTGQRLETDMNRKVPPALEIPLELIDFDIDEFFGDREEQEESTVLVGDTPRSNGSDPKIRSSNADFAQEYDSERVLSTILAEEGIAKDKPSGGTASDPSQQVLNEEDEMVSLLLEANKVDTTDSNDQPSSSATPIPILVAGRSDRLGSSPNVATSSGLDDIDEKAIAARVDEAKIRARMRSQQTFLTSTLLANAQNISAVDGIGVASSVASSVSSWLLQSHIGVTKEKIEELKAMREFALAKRLEALEAKMAEGQRKRLEELDALQKNFEKKEEDASVKGGDGPIPANNKFGVKYCGKKSLGIGSNAKTSASGAPRRPPTELQPSNPYTLMAQRLQQQLDDHRKAKGEAHAQAQERRTRLNLIDTDRTLSKVVLSENEAPPPNSAVYVQVGLARAAAKAKGQLLTDQERARVDDLLSFNGLWGAVGTSSSPSSVAADGLVSDTATDNKDAEKELEKHLASLLGDGYVPYPKDQQRSALIDEQLQRLQMAREQLAFSQGDDDASESETASISGSTSRNTNGQRKKESVDTDGPLVGLAKVDAALLSPNVSALLHRLQQQHDRKWQQQQADQLQNSLASVAPTPSAKSPLGATGTQGPQEDLRTLEQIADAKLDSQRRRLGNMYLKEAAEAKLQRAYLKQLNAELDRIYAQNEALESDPTFSMSKKYDLHRDPHSLAFPEGVQPVTHDQLQRLLVSAKAEEELLKPSTTTNDTNPTPETVNINVSSTQSEVLTPFQEALRARLARAQQLLAEEAARDQRRQKEDEEEREKAKELESPYEGDKPEEDQVVDSVH